MLVTFKRLCGTRSVVLVWMELQGEFSVGSFQFILRGVGLDPEYFIEVFTLFYSAWRTNGSQYQVLIKGKKWAKRGWCKTH